MGLFSKILGVVGKVAPVIPGPGGLIAKVAGGLARAKKVTKVVGAAAGTGAAFEVGSRVVARGGARGATSQLVDPRTGLPFRKKRRTGLSGRDILGAQKVARLVHAFGYKPKIKPRRKGR